MRTSLSKGVSPAEVVLAENLHRRHLTVSQRAQMVAEANEWESRGGDRRSGNINGSNEPMKSTSEMAVDANVSQASIKRAKQVSRLGRSEEVISGEKSASAVIVEEQEKVVPVEREEVEALRDDLKVLGGTFESEGI